MMKLQQCRRVFLNRGIHRPTLVANSYRELRLLLDGGSEARFLYQHFAPNSATVSPIKTFTIFTPFEGNSSILDLYSYFIDSHLNDFLFMHFVFCAIPSKVFRLPPQDSFLSDIRSTPNQLKHLCYGKPTEPIYSGLNALYTLLLIFNP